MNPDTHPDQFRLMRDGERVPKEAIYKELDNRGWFPANISIGMVQKTTSINNLPFYVPITTQQPTESKTMSLQSVAIMHTPKVAPGSIAASEEILVGSTEVAATDQWVAVALVAAQNAETVIKYTKISTLRVIVKAVG